MPNKDTVKNSKETSTTFWHIPFFALLFLPLIAMFPIKLQELSQEKSKLEQQKQQILSQIKIQEKEINNLNVNLSHYRGVALKSRAEALGLHAPTPEQIVYIRDDGSRGQTALVAGHFRSTPEMFNRASAYNANPKLAVQK